MTGYINLELLGMVKDMINRPERHYLHASTDSTTTTTAKATTINSTVKTKGIKAKNSGDIETVRN